MFRIITDQRKLLKKNFEKHELRAEQNGGATFAQGGVGGV